ncbi:hypothetical protein EEDFHM_03853 [Methylorubrum populi]
MPIPTSTPVTEAIAGCLTRAFLTGRAAGRIEARLGHGRARQFDPDGITAEVLANLDRAGIDIAPKAAPVTLTLPDGDRVSGPDVVELAAHLSAGAEADDDRRDGMRCGTVAMLTPEGERVLAAIARGDLASLSERAVYSAIELVGRLDDAALRLEPGQEDEAPAPVCLTGSPWVVMEVRPGETTVGEGTDIWDHGITTSARAVMKNMITGAEREIRVDAAAFCDRGEGEVREAVEVAIRDAMRKAREAAAAFIAATAAGEAA